MTKKLYYLKAMMSLLNNKKLVAVLILFSVFLNGISAIAAEPYPSELVELKAQLKANLSDSSYDTCRSQLVPIYDLEILEFFKYLETTFENKSSNSTLMNLAIARYSRFKYRINDTFTRLKPLSTSDSKTYLQLLANYNKCIEITQEYINLGKKKFIEHVKKNNSQKKSTMLLEKYKAINERLRGLNFQVAQMYSSFVTMNNKLPGFLKQCVKN